MTGKATLVISSDTKDGEKAIANLVKEMTKIREENKKLKEENKKAAEEAKQQAKEQAEAHRKKLQEIQEERKAEREKAQEEKRLTEEQIRKEKEEQRVKKEKAREEKRIADEQKRAAKEKADQERRFATAILTTAGTYISLNTVLSATNKMLERQDELQRKIAEHSVASGQSQLDVVLNMQGATDAQKRAAVASAKNIDQQTGFGDIGAINQAMATALSASSGNQEAASEAVMSAARISGGREDLLNAYTGAALGVATRTGRSTDESLGAVLQSGALAGVTEPAKQARLFRQVAASGVSRDTTGRPDEAARQSMVLASALSSIAGETEGETTRTATIAFEAALSDLFKGRKDDPGLALERLSAIQQDPALGRQFASRYSFEKLYEDIIKRVATDPSYEGSRLIQDYSRQIDYDTKAYQAQQKSVQGLTPELRALARQNQIKAIGNAGADTNRDEALIQQIEEARVAAREIADPLGYSWVDSIAGAAARATVGTTGSEEDRARIRILQTQQLRMQVGGVDVEGVDGASPQRREAAAEIDRLIDVQQRAFEELQSLRQENQRSTLRAEGSQEPGRRKMIRPDVDPSLFYSIPSKHQGATDTGEPGNAQSASSDRQSSEELLERQIGKTERVIQELEALNASVKKPSVRPQGMQEAN